MYPSRSRTSPACQLIFWHICEWQLTTESEGEKKTPFPSYNNKCQLYMDKRWKMNILKIIMLRMYKLLLFQYSVGVWECHSMEMQKSEDFFQRCLSPEYWLRSLSSVANAFTHGRHLSIPNVSCNIFWKNILAFFLIKFFKVMIPPPQDSEHLNYRFVL